MRNLLGNILPMLGLVAFAWGVTPAQAQQACDIESGCNNGPEPLYCGCTIATQANRTLLRAGCDAVAENTGHRSGVLRPANINDDPIGLKFASVEDAADVIPETEVTLFNIVNEQNNCSFGAITGVCDNEEQSPQVCLGAGTVGTIEP